jgi:Ser/Thr protein kinase RdoA (MazF antagonist)
MQPPAYLPKILALYDIPDATLIAMQKGYRNQSHVLQLQSGTRCNLIIYKAEPGIVNLIKNANAVSNFAATRGLPTRRTAHPKITRLTTTKYAALYDYLPGDTIPWEAYTMAKIKALGECLGKLHGGLVSFNVTILPDAAQHNIALNQRIVHYFERTDVRLAMDQKLHVHIKKSDFTRLHQLCAQLPDQQALHLDFVRGNILFKGDHICGILDFEKTARGHRIIDVARTLAFLLVDCKFKPEAKIRKYFLQSGYKKRGGQPLITQRIILEELVNFYLLHDFYKFLRHNPYESLLLNEHFVRTRDLLLRRGILN